MKIAFNHEWDLTPQAAIVLQKELARQVKISMPTRDFRYIAGIDCAPSPDKQHYFAAVVVWDAKDRELTEYHLAQTKLKFPYIPGLLSFREVPAILEVLKKLQREPDLFIVDGHGIAHPRRLGIASHVGILLNKPTFGCAKSLLYGHYCEPNAERGNYTPLYAKDNSILGNVVRTRDKVKPVIVSVGHLLDLPTITELTLRYSGRFRLPEPTHLADKLVAQKQVKSVIYPEAPELNLPANYTTLSPPH